MSSSDSPGNDLTDRSGRGAGLAAVVSAVTAFSWGFILVKAISLSMPALAFWRVFLGAVILSAAALLLRVRWTERWGLVFGAGIAFGAHQLIFIGAVKLTSIAIVTTLGATMPLWVMLLSRRAVGERVPPALFLCALLALAGIAVVVYASAGDASRHWQGDVLSAVNVAAFTAYYLFTKRARDAGAPTLTITAGSQLVALLVVFPAMLFWTGPELPGQHDFVLLAILVLGPANGHLLLNWAHPRVSAALGSLVLSAVPALSSVWAFLVLHEAFTWQHALGIGLVIAAIEAGRRAEGAPAALSAARSAAGEASSAAPR